jgi:hypothetical protein
MILKYACRNFGRIMTTPVLFQKLITTLTSDKNASFSPKTDKIAQNCVPNLDPWPHLFSFPELFDGGDADAGRHLQPGRLRVVVERGEAGGQNEVCDTKMGVLRSFADRQNVDFQTVDI